MWLRRCVFCSSLTAYRREQPEVPQPLFLALVLLSQARVYVPSTLNKNAAAPLVLFWWVRSESPLGRCRGGETLSRSARTHAAHLPKLRTHYCDDIIES